MPAHVVVEPELFVHALPGLVANAMAPVLGVLCQVERQGLELSSRPTAKAELNGGMQ